MKQWHVWLLALALGIMGCGAGQDGVSPNDSLNGTIDLRVDGGSDVVSSDTADGASPSDGSDAAVDVATDAVNPSDATDAADVTDALADNGGDVSSDVTDATDVTDVTDVTDASDVPPPRCGDGFCTLASGEMCATCSSDCGSCPPVDSGVDVPPADTGTDVPPSDTGVDVGTDTGPADAGTDVPVDSGPRCGDGMCTSSETCSSCVIDCGSCPPVDAGTDVPPADTGVDAGADTGPTDTGVDAGTDSGPTDVGTDVMTCPTGLTLCGTFCRDTSGGDPNNCGSCGNRCPDPANGFGTCGGGVCGFSCNTGFVRCGTGCVPAYPVLIKEYTGAIATRMAHTDLRIALDASPVTVFVRDACIGGFTTITGGFRCQVDLARIMACAPLPARFGTHTVFRDSSLRPLITGRTPGTSASVCYPTAGDIPCVTSTCSSRVYIGGEYINHNTGEVDPVTSADLYYVNEGPAGEPMSLCP